jgi:hypothetical protein
MYKEGRIFNSQRGILLSNIRGMLKYRNYRNERDEMMLKNIQRRSKNKICCVRAKWIMIALLALIVTISIASSVSAYESISSSDVIEKIENGDPVNYDHVVILGRLDVAQLNLSENENGRKIIKSSISITDSIIDDNLLFSNIIFDKTICFENTSFRDACDFSSSIFSERANFISTKYYKNVSFIYTHFMGDVFFLSTMFFRDANFWETTFAEDVDFGSAIFNRNAIFKFAAFKGDGYFNNATFNGSLNLDRAKFSKVEVRFNSIEGHIAYNENTYLKLIENFKSLGWFNDADNCYFYYRTAKQEQSELGWSKLTDTIGLITCGYGVRPGYTLLLSCALVIFFGLLYHLGKGIAGLNSNNLVAQISFPDALYYSTIVFVSHPQPNWYPNGRWKYVVLAEKIMGWLLLALFIVTLGRVMIR